MTDQQLALIIAAIVSAAGSIAGVLRWAVVRLVRALDANTSAFIAAEKAAAVQAEVLRSVAEEVRRVSEWCDRHTGVTEVAEGIRPKKPVTAPRGYSIVRGRTNHDEDS